MNVPEDSAASVSEGTWQRLSELAWSSREQARTLGATKVGAAVLSAEGEIFPGCNVEHQFRSHDVHAEVNALATMVAHGHKQAVAILIASERDRFTPCGACLDWIFELGGPNCLVAFQPSPRSERNLYRADDLMPYYPH